MTRSADGSADEEPGAGRNAFGSAADAADAASRDAQLAARLAADAKVEAELAAELAAMVASRARDATAVAVASAASAAAKVAAGAAAAVASEAVARAFDAAVMAVGALEAVAAQLPAGVDLDDARRAAESVARDVAEDVLVEARITADAATKVADAVTAAAQKAAEAAAVAATAVEQDTAAAVAAGEMVAGSVAATAAATQTVFASTERVVDLTGRLRVAAALLDSEQRFNVIFQDSPLGMTLISLDAPQAGRLLHINQAMREITGRTEDDLLKLRWVDLVHPDDRNDQAALFMSVLDGEVSHSESEVRWADTSGHTRWVRLRLHALHEVKTGPAYAIGQVEDITNRRRAETALRAREERFRLAFDNAVTGMMFLSLSGTLRTGNGALLEFLGRSERELVGQHLESMICRDERTSLRAGIDELAAGVTSGYQAEHRFDRFDGSEVWGAVSGMLVDDEDGRPSYLVFQVRDISWRKHAESRLAHQALHDGLTGLPNRVLFDDRLGQASARATRNGTYVAVLFIDIDDFKDINDSHGHAAGDQVLVEFARRLAVIMRDTDTACRWGGDEFVVVCNDLSDPTDVTPVADRVAAIFNTPFAVAGTELAVTASVGITTDDGSAPLDDLLRGADTAMFRAKDLGKGRSEIYGPELRATVQGNATLAGQLRHAIADGQLRLHYQPMVSMTSGAIVGVEALLRWQHPTLGLLRPARFLDLAESYRMMIPIGDWVLATAVTQAAQWQNNFGTDAPDMWVNISSQQLGQQHLTSVISTMLARTGLPPNSFGLEITERHLLEETEDVRSDLLEVNSLGVRLAVDDFGTGYGSFDYLRRFPISSIKIDMSFISGLGIDRTDTAVTEAIIALGRSLDLDVVAEGVETQHQYDHLNDLGCGLVQGYLLHRPAPPETIHLLLSAGPRPSAT